MRNLRHCSIRNIYLANDWVQLRELLNKVCDLGVEYQGLCPIVANMSMCRVKRQIANTKIIGGRHGSICRLGIYSGRLERYLPADWLIGRG